jgi:uncharacterized pyridoxamine 5'-phosphate oxidase family protein
VHETAEDLERLQGLLDESYAAAGEHLRSIFSPQRRIPAADLAGLLTGVQVLALATVTARGEPRVAPVDGLFFRGRFHFGSAHNSARFRHLRARPAVSATHLRGEELAVIVHGTAHEIDTSAAEHAGFRSCLEETYPGWASWASDAPYAVIEPAKMFTYRAG